MHAEYLLPQGDHQHFLDYVITWYQSGYISFLFTTDPIRVVNLVIGLVCLSVCPGGEQCVHPDLLYLSNG